MHFGARHPEGAVLGLADGVLAAADRSSASRCRSRTWSPRRTAAGRSRRRRRCPCAAPSAAGSSPAARCRACAGSRIAAASAARAIPHRSFRSRISRRPVPARIAASGKRARPNRLATDASRIRRSIMMVSVRSETDGSLPDTARAPRSYTEPDEISHFVARPARLPGGRRRRDGLARRPASAGAAAGRGGPAAGGAWRPRFRPAGWPRPAAPRGSAPAPRRASR